jgi:hypothetical protein
MQDCIVQKPIVSFIIPIAFPSHYQYAAKLTKYKQASARFLYKSGISMSNFRRTLCAGVRTYIRRCTHKRPYEHGRIALSRINIESKAFLRLSTCAGSVIVRLCACARF